MDLHRGVGSGLIRGLHSARLIPLFVVNSSWVLSMRPEIIQCWKQGFFQYVYLPGPMHAQHIHIHFQGGKLIKASAFIISAPLIDSTYCRRRFMTAVQIRPRKYAWWWLHQRRNMYPSFPLCMCDAAIKYIQGKEVPLYKYCHKSCIWWLL